MNAVQLVLGNQLFYPFTHLNKQIPVVMIEHNDLCKDRAHHKIKVAFFFSAMRHYAEDLIKNGFNVIYETYNPNEELSFISVLLRLIPSLDTIHLTEIVDVSVRETFEDELTNKGIAITFNKTPMFLNSVDHFTNYLSTIKKPFMKTYYERIRKESGILMTAGKPEGGAFSFDEMNRKKCPKGLRIPPREFPAHSSTTTAVIELVNTHFKDHVGDASDLWLPVTRIDALNWWQAFLANHFNLFGDYEDAIEPSSDFLFHSAISPLLNIGLLTPQQVINDVLSLSDQIPLNSLEGFIRQVIGWREFIRGIYEHYNDDQQATNFFNHTGKLTQHWWDGTTGHLPLDDAIKTTVKRGYAHHINRLMVIGATMLTTEVAPQEVYNWFMVMYADSSDWVMGPNVFGMSQFSDGGIFATKPYICGSNYIRKMSHYGTGDWCDIADGLYWRFIHKHSDFFTKNARMGLAVKSLDKMAADKKTRLFKAANAFIERVTH